MTKPFIMACIPAGTHVHTDFFSAYAEMQGHTLLNAQRQFPDGITMAQLTIASSILQIVRTRLVEISLRERATHILFADSDMVFPPNALLRLLAQDKDIVGVNYPTKEDAPKPTAEAHDAKNALHTRLHSSGLEKANYIGTGLMLVKTSVFETLEPPWFQTPWMPEHNGFMTEDVYFCLYARHKGFTTWCDHDLSKEICHVGQRRFMMKDVPGWDDREVDPEIDAGHGILVADGDA